MIKQVSVNITWGDYEVLEKAYNLLKKDEPINHFDLINLENIINDFRNKLTETNE